MSSLKLFIFILSIALFVPWALAQAPKVPQPAQKASGPFKVALLPLTIHSPENLEYMREGMNAMFSSRVELEGRVTVLEGAAVKKALSEVSGEIDSETAQKLGETLGADFVVFGSLTKLGDSSSVDLKVVDVKGEKPASSVYVQARKMEEIIAQVDVLARKIDEKILGYSISPAVAEKPPEPSRQAAVVVPPPVFAPAAPPASAAPQAPPAAQQATSSSLPPVFGGGSAPSPSMGKGMVVGEFSRSEPFKYKVKGMAMGDFDGDGRIEIAIIEERKLHIYRWENEFKLLKEFSGKDLDQYLAVDAADINKDGKAEIFVTNFPEAPNMPGFRLTSFVVAFRDGDYRIVASEIDWFLRVVEWPGKGPVLLGQKKGENKSFTGPIYEMGWDGKRYKELRKIDLPRLFCPYGFAPFTYEGKTYYAFIDADFYLKVLDEKGKQIWRSSAYYPTDNPFTAKAWDPGADRGDEIAFVNVRVLAQGADLILIRNISPVSDLFKQAKAFSGGEIQILTWTGGLFMERWKSKEISGYVADIQIQDFDNVPGKEMVAVVNLPKESALSSNANSALIVSRVQ